MRPDDFLSSGLLPKELPPCFSSQSLRNMFQGNPALSLASSKFISKPSSYSLARAGGARRNLKLVNPFGYYRLVEKGCAFWPQIELLINRSTISLSKPIKDQSKVRAVVPTTPMPRLSSERQLNRTKGHFALIADISEFYPTLYTHAIGWAVDGKAAAKASKGKNRLLGDVLDELTRYNSDNETTGIPIGDDFSFITAELVLSAVDERLSSQCRYVSAIRYFDDYEIIFDTREGANTGRSILESILKDFNLHLNPRKTKVVELPSQLENTWIRDLRSFELTRLARRSRIYDFFDLAIEHQESNPDQLVMSYAISRFDHVISANNWSALEPILLQVLRTIPAAAPIAINTLAMAQSKGIGINTNSLSEVLNHVIGSAAKNHHSSEACWAMWAIGAFGLKINDVVLKQLETTQDAVVLLTALYLNELGHYSRTIDTTRCEQLTATDFCKNEYWMLGYEAYTRKWIPRQSKYIEGNPFFQLMEASNCSFLSPISIQNQQIENAARHLRPYDEVVNLAPPSASVSLDDI